MNNQEAQAIVASKERAEQQAVKDYNAVLLSWHNKKQNLKNIKGGDAAKIAEVILQVKSEIEEHKRNCKEFITNRKIQILSGATEPPILAPLFNLNLNSNTSLASAIPNQPLTLEEKLLVAKQ